MNERITEDIVRDHFKNDVNYNKILIEEQKSKIPRVNKLLKNASKSGFGGGRPEFLITFKENPDLIIVVECKANIAKHQSDTKDKYKDCAVDGVLLYSSFLSKEYDVLSIAVSGEDVNNLKISHLLQLKGEENGYSIFGEKLLSINNYLKEYIYNERKFNQEYHELLKYSKSLNDSLHSKKIKESQRSLLISGILIALDDEAFKVSYKKHKKTKQLANSLVTTVKNQLSNTLNQDKIENLTMVYSFIKTQTALSQEEDVLKDLIADIDKHINTFIKTYNYFDVLGQFYIEFLKYANNDKGLGIVLTPPHITELFSDLAMVNQNSVILDNCAGTGGFLISAMKKMIDKAKGDIDKIQNIHEKQIVGIEYQDDIFALACSNMYIHGDGKSNVIHGDCFKKEIIKTIKTKYKPNIGFLNPPYKTDKDDPEELEFVLNNLDMLEQNGKCIAIIPISCVLAESGIGLELKKKLLTKHTLEGVMSMPSDLFHNSKAGVITSIMVITAHVPHPKNKKTWFGYWRDDGFAKVKGKGRIDLNNTWNKIKNEWIIAYRNKESIPNLSVMQEITPESEWCAEAFLETNYDDLNFKMFEQELKKYVAFQIINGD